MWRKMLLTILTVFCYLIAALVVFALLGLLYAYCFFQGLPVYFTSKASLNGKVAIVTGANTGIGKVTAMDLAKRGAKVILACRSRERAMPAVDVIKAACGHDNVVFEQLDVKSLHSVRDFANRIRENEKRLDILVNNAGVAHDKSKSDTKIDSTFLTNHVGPFLLTFELLDLLKASAPSRIVNVASCVHNRGEAKHGLNFTIEEGRYKYLRRYNCSKLANILHCLALTKILKGTGVTANSLHPGAVYTDIWRVADNMLPSPLAKLVKAYLKLVFWSSEAGAQTSIYLAVDENLETVTGKYFFKCAEASGNFTPSKHATDENAAKELWAVSEEMAGVPASKSLKTLVNFS